MQRISETTYRSALPEGYRYGNRSVRDWTEGGHFAVIVMHFGACKGGSSARTVARVVRAIGRERRGAALVLRASGRSQEMMSDGDAESLAPGVLGGSARCASSLGSARCASRVYGVGLADHTQAARVADMQLLRLARRLMPEGAVQPLAASSPDRRRALSDHRAGRRMPPRGRCARAPAHRHGPRP